MYGRIYEDFVISIDSGIFEHFGYEKYYMISKRIKNIISYLYNNQIFNNNTSGYLNLNIDTNDDGTRICIHLDNINKIYKSSIKKEFRGGFWFDDRYEFDIRSLYSSNSNKYENISDFSKAFIKFNEKHFNLIKLSLKNFLKINNIPIVKEYLDRYGRYLKINDLPKNDGYFTYLDKDIKILLVSLCIYIMNKLHYSTNINDYKCDEVFTLDNNTISSQADNKINNDINTETVNDNKEETSSSNDTDKNILDDDIIKKLFLKYIDNAKKGVLEFENSFKKQENIKDADKKEAEEKIKAANFFILSAEYNIEKENNVMNYINKYNKTIEQINSDFNNIMNRYRKISTLVYVMDVDMEDFNDVYIPKFDINNILKDLIN
ncbi:hypothetical protein R4J17_08425 [Brachyspira intermedia]|uniref:hypothetical protein n=1 Tax=Brachyspira intermedia TaxID=84377 RepID=UPI0030061036